MIQPDQDTGHQPLGWREQARAFVAAVRFLSILPLPGTAQLFDKDEIGERVIVGGAYFPLVGLILVALLWLLLLLITPFAPSLVLAALLLIAEVLLTGGLHIDGLMDSCDGLFGGRTRERKLEIMRDSRVGSFGVLSGACLLILKFACLASLPAYILPFVLLMTLPTARWCMVLALYIFPSARNTGLGALYHQAITLRHLLIAGTIALLIALFSGRIAGIGLWILATGVSFALGTWITRQLGGLTGDNYGAIAEIAEVVTLLAAVLLYNKA